MADEILVPGTEPSASTPAPATEGAPAPQTATQTAPTQPAATAGVPPPGREDWVPSYRLREAREAAQRQAQQEYNQQVAQARADAERYKQQVMALTGATPPPDPGIQQVRGQFGQLYPGLSKIEERAEEILGILERAGDLESQNQHYWKSYGQRTMDQVFSKTAEAIGGPLSEEGKRQLHSSFVGFVQSSPELTDRYANDPTIVEDFVKAFTSNFIDPVRRASTATVAGRAAVVAGLPQDTPSGAPRSSPVPQPANLDERASAAWNLYQSTHKP